MAFGHAVDGPGRLLAVLEALANAPEDIASLKSLVANIKMAFEGVQSTTSSISSNRGQFQGSHQSVAASLACVSRLEALVDDSLTKRGRRANERARKVVDSFAWIWRRKEVDAIKQQLQDSVPAVLPEVSSLSL
jgi:hypothetical protein